MGDDFGDGATFLAADLGEAGEQFSIAESRDERVHASRIPCVFLTSLLTPSARFEHRNSAKVVARASVSWRASSREREGIRGIHLDRATRGRADRVKIKIENRHSETTGTTAMARPAPRWAEHGRSSGVSAAAARAEVWACAALRASCTR